jgi:NOL1/NOP2/fmu family ribosome biogenesis protein
MKLRIKGDSLRLRIAPAEMARLLETGCVEDTIHFGQDKDAQLTYALEHGDVRAIALRHEPARVAVVLPVESAREWARGEDVGVYGRVAVAGGRLEIAVEKDWACLDKSDRENADTFPNPNAGARC